MPRTSRKLENLVHFSTRASILAGLVTLSVTSDTESKDSGPVLTSSLTGTETETEQVRCAPHKMHSGKSYISASSAPVSGSFGFEDQRLVSPIETNGLLSDLEEYRELENGWNGYGAPAIPDDVIDLAKEVAVWPEIASRAPAVFPTGRESIQFEFSDANGDEAELEIFSREDSILLIDPEDGEMFERRNTLQNSISTLDELLEA